MGVWGVHAFENDDAQDWAGGGLPGETELKSAFAAVLKRTAYLQAPECNVALAAAEVVAAMMGGPTPNVPEPIRQLTSAQGGVVDDDLIFKAVEAVVKIAADSELRELWDETPDGPAWHSYVSDLEARLRSRKNRK